MCTNLGGEQGFRETAQRNQTGALPPNIAINTEGGRTTFTNALVLVAQHPYVYAERRNTTRSDLKAQRNIGDTGMLGKREQQLNITLTINEAAEVCIAASVALDDTAFMSLPETDREALVSAIRKIYAAHLPYLRAVAS